MGLDYLLLLALELLNTKTRYEKTKGLWPETRSLGVEEDIVIVRIDSPVLTLIVLLREILLVISEEGVELETLFEVFDCLYAPDVL